MAEKKAKNPKMSQITLFETVRRNEENGQSKKSEKKEPASELMKVIAEKIPSKKKISGKNL